MKSTWVKSVVFLVAGAMIGFITCSVLVSYRQNSEHYYSLSQNHPAKAGDIEINVHADKNDETTLNAMTMTKNGNTFLGAEIDSDGQMTDLYIGNNDKVILTLKYSQALNKWVRATYFGETDGRSEVYWDLDFNGTFDVRAITRETDARKRYIRLGGTFESVDILSFEPATATGIAAIGADKYIFEHGRGWQISKHSADPDEL